MSYYPEIEGHYLPILDQIIRYLRELESIQFDASIKSNLAEICDFLIRLNQLLMNFNEN